MAGPPSREGSKTRKTSFGKGKGTVVMVKNPEGPPNIGNRQGQHLDIFVQTLVEKFLL